VNTEKCTRRRAGNADSSSSPRRMHGDGAGSRRAGPGTMAKLAWRVPYILVTEEEMKRMLRTEPDLVSLSERGKDWSGKRSRTRSRRHD